MASGIAAVQGAETPKPPPSQPNKGADCGVAPEPEQKPAYLSDNSSKHEKPAFPQDHKDFGGGAFPQDQHDGPREAAASEQPYPQDKALFANHATFPQDRPMGLSGCPEPASHTHS
jgi:hypothetical protein